MMKNFQIDPSSAFVYCAFGTVIIAFFIVGFLPPADEVVLAINGMHTTFLDFFFVFLTNLGNGVVIVPFIVLLSFRSIYLAVGLLLSGVVDGALVTMFKRILFSNAGRPLTVLDPEFVYFVPGVEVHRSMTFPSGHTVTIFGLCIFLALCYRSTWLTIGLTVLALLVALSRVYLLQHFMGDLAGGALIGATVGIIVYHWIEQMNKPLWMNRRIEIKFKLSNPKPRFS